MVYHALSTFSENLAGHLSRVFALHDDMVQLCTPDGNKSASMPNKLSVMLVGVERETAGGISFPHGSAAGRLSKSAPPWQINLYVLVAALFADKQYGEGLRFLSESMRYMQNHPTLTVPALGKTLAVEPVNLSFSELSNLWSICGGSYRPSVLYKIRVLQLADGEITGTAIPITQKETGL